MRRLGDVTGDGLDDLVLPGDGYGGEGIGAVRIYSGGARYAGELDTSFAAAVITGEMPGDTAAASLAVADVDGDAIADLLIGADRSEIGGELRGAAYLVYGGALPPILGLVAADLIWRGETFGDAEEGWSDWLARDVGAGDLDGEGRADVLLGAAPLPTVSGSRDRVRLVYDAPQ